VCKDVRVVCDGGPGAIISDVGGSCFSCSVGSPRSDSGLGEGAWTLGAGIGGSCDFVAEAPESRLGFVSIFSCLAFWPDSRRSRTPGPGGGLSKLSGREFDGVCDTDGVCDDDEPGVGTIGRAPTGGG
jgi:hypothetical protein